MHYSRFAVVVGGICALAQNAAAFDPNAGADEPVARYTPLPESVVPHRYYAPDALSTNAAYAAPVANVAPQPVMIAPLPAVAEVPAPAVISPLPETRIVPVEQPVAAATPAPVYYAAQPVPITQAPAVVPYYPPQPITNATSYKVNRYSIGVEAFWDRYREDIADLESNSGYGAIEGGWTHYYRPNWYSTVELRGSYGQEDYKSISGTLDGTDQWEIDGRLLAGYDAPVSRGHLKTYLGLDTRYYRDEGKGGVTSLGFNAYDRRIFQVMLPVGLTYDMRAASGFHYIPTIEAGPLLYGNVSSRLGNIPGFTNIENKQHTGYEVRAEFMMNNLNEDSGRGWEFGPFVRYFHMEDSGTDTIPAGTFIEPKNSRLQLGAKLKYLF